VTPALLVSKPAGHAPHVTADVPAIAVHVTAGLVEQPPFRVRQGSKYWHRAFARDRNKANDALWISPVSDDGEKSAVAAPYSSLKGRYMTNEVDGKTSDTYAARISFAVRVRVHTRTSSMPPMN
jgi:hypothetical protein